MVEGPRTAVTTKEKADEVSAQRLANLASKKQDKCPLCQLIHYFDKSWPKVSPPTSTKMVSTQLQSFPEFIKMLSAQRVVAVSSHEACLQCTSWEHLQHKGQGGVPMGDPKCKFKIAGVECAKKHGPWFHPMSASGASTNCAVGAHYAQEVSGNSPGLYEVYSVGIAGQGGEVVEGTVFADPGSDTDYVRHDYAQALGLVGEPHVCYLKVVDTEYRELKTVRYRLTIEDREGTKHWITAIGLDSITALPREPDLAPLLPLLQEVSEELKDVTPEEVLV